MFTRSFWKATAERAIKTFAQTLAALLVAMPIGVGLMGVDFAGFLGIAGLAALVSVLTSVGSGLNGSGPSLVNAETLTETRV